MTPAMTLAHQRTMDPSLPADVVDAIAKSAPEGVQVQMIRHLALNQDVENLKRFAAHGAFDMTTLGGPPDKRTALLSSHEMQKVASLNFFMVGQIAHSTSAENLMNLPPILEVSREFRDFFNDTAIAYTRSFDNWRGRFFDDGSNSNDARFVGSNAAYAHTLAGLMAGACALDLPDLVKHLSERHQYDNTVRIDPIVLGLSSNQVNLLGENYQMRITPTLTALHFDRHETWDKLMELGYNPAENAGVAYGGKGQDYFDEKLVTAADLLAFGTLRPSPEMLPKMLAALQDTLGGYCKTDKDALVQHALGALSVQSGAQSAWVPHYMAAGLYDINPRRSAAEAIKENCPDVLKHVAPKLSWETDDDHPQHLIEMAVFNAQNHASPELHENYVIDLIDMVAAAGKLQQMFDYRRTHSMSRSGTSIADAVIEAVMPRAMYHMLELGLDPEQRNARGLSNNLIESAQQAREPKLEAVIRAFQARKLTDGLLQELNADAKSDYNGASGVSGLTGQAFMDKIGALKLGSRAPGTRLAP